MMRHVILANFLTDYFSDLWVIFKDYVETSVDNFAAWWSANGDYIVQWCIASLVALMDFVTGWLFVLLGAVADILVAGIVALGIPEEWVTVAKAWILAVTWFIPFDILMRVFTLCVTIALAWWVMQLILRLLPKPAGVGQRW